MRRFLWSLSVLFGAIVLAPFGQGSLAAHEPIEAQNYVVENSFNTCQIRVSGSEFLVHSHAYAHDVRGRDIDSETDESSSYEIVDSTLSSSAQATSGNVHTITSANGSIEYKLFDQTTGLSNIGSSYVNGAKLDYSTEWSYENTSTWPNMSLNTYGSYDVTLSPRIDGVIEILHTASSAGDYVSAGSIAWLQSRPWVYDSVPTNGSGIVTKTVKANTSYIMRFASVRPNSPSGAYENPFSGNANTTFEWKFIPNMAMTGPTDHNINPTDSQGNYQLRISSVDTYDRSVINGGEWIDLENTTVDGNIVRISVDIENDGYIGFAQLAFFNAETDELIGTLDNLEFPEENNDPYHFEWDTTGYAWHSDGSPRVDATQIKVVLSHCVDGVQEKVDEATTSGILIKPKPIILVHGLWSNSLTWEPYLQPGGYLRSAHPNWSGWAIHTMDTGGWAPNPRPINSILQNARLLDEYIQFVRGNQNAWHIDIVAHSMGGLISRAYIDQYMPLIPFSEYVPVVDHLIMIGTPNQGSPCANLFALSSLIELRPDFMALSFNKDVTDRKWVRFSNFVGNNWSFTCDSLEKGDMVVPISSARWNLYPEALLEGGITHTEMTKDEYIFDNYVLPRILNRPFGNSYQASGAIQDVEVINETSNFTNSSDPQLLLTEPVQIPANSNQDISIVVPESTVFGVTFSAPPSIGIQLLDPDNNIIGEYPAYSPEAGELFRSLRVDNPVSGEWVVRIDNQDSNLAHSELASWIEGNSIQLELEEHVDKKNLQLSLLATLNDGEMPIINAAVSANLSDFEGNEVSATLFDDGMHDDNLADDGIYGATMDVSSGLYSIRVRAEGADFIRYTTGATSILQEYEVYIPVIIK